MKTLTLLTPLMLSGIKPKPKAFSLYDAQYEGLALRVQPSGVRSWVFWDRVDSKTRKITLGRYPGMALEEARKFMHAHQSGLGKVAPSLSTTITFATLCERFLSAKARVYRPSTIGPLNDYLRTQLLPAFGNQPVGRIRTPDMARWFHAYSRLRAGGTNKALGHFTTILNWGKAQDLIFQAYDDMPLTENHIRQLHQVFLRHSPKEERHRGGYKKRNNHVVAIDADGKEIGVIFETATPFKTPRQMEELVLWARKAIQEESMHPLLIVAEFTVQFLAIHPSQDGNGRLSRVLTTVMLLRAGYAYVPYASLESVIEENKDIYYKSLRRTQATLKGNAPDWTPWIGFFLRCLKEQKNNLVVRLDREQSQAHEADMPELSLQILELFDEYTRLNLSKIVALTGANKNIIKVRLRELVNAGRLTKHGKARATWYVRT